MECFYVKEGCRTNVESHISTEKRQNSRILIILLCILLAAAIGVIIWLITSGKVSVISGADNGSKHGGLVVPERQEMIQVTAYEYLELKADSLQQDVHLSTISDNECITVMSLVLEDGTELWQSGELYPGQIVLSMTLSQPLPAGEYPNTVLRYQHFTLDEEKTPLNNAETLLTLKVQ